MLRLAEVEEEQRSVIVLALSLTGEVEAEAAVEPSVLVKPGV